MNYKILLILELMCMSPPTSFFILFFFILTHLPGLFFSLLLSCLYTGNLSPHQFGLQVSICYFSFFPGPGILILFVLFSHFSPLFLSTSPLHRMWCRKQLPCPLTSVHAQFSSFPFLLFCLSPWVKSEIDSLQSCLKSCQSKSVRVWF